MERPSDEIMQAIAAVAFEQATTFFADMADRFADEAPVDVSGAEALYTGLLRWHPSIQGPRLVGGLQRMPWITRGHP